MLAPKLNQGDEIRVIAPSYSLSHVWEEKAQTVREMIVSFCLQGGERTMTLFNTRHGGQN